MKPPGRTDNAWRKGNYLSGSGEPPREIQILKNRHIFKPVQLIKHGSADKNRLVPKEPSRHRQVASQQLNRRKGDSLSNRRANPPPTAAGFCNAISIWLRLMLRKWVSACRKRRISPVADLAPEFICKARPVTGGDVRALATTFGPYWPAIWTVSSVLPPSETMISCCGAFWARR